MHFGLCLGLGIALLSGKEGGAGGMTSWFLEVFFHLTQEQAELIVHIVRKVFHFIFYGTIAATFTSIGTAMSLEFRKAALFGASWATIHALFDEIRQSLSPGRSGSAIDLLIDAAGMAVFVYRGKAIASSRSLHECLVELTSCPLPIKRLDGAQCGGWSRGATIDRAEGANFPSRSATGPASLISCSSPLTGG